MGYALFTARKMSLQAKVNQYNLQLMQISNKETELTQKTARMQQAHNRIDAGQNAGSFLAQVGGAIGGFVLSGCNPAGAVAGYKLGGVAGDGINTLTDKAQSAARQYQETELARQQQELDTEKQRINTLLNAAQNELQQVEKAEESAIKSSTPQYVA